MTKTNNKPLIVGIGASAGGLEAFGEFLAGLNEQPGFAIVFVQHLDPNSTSLLPQLLEQRTTLDVVIVNVRTKINPDTIYLCPPQSLLEIRGESLMLVDEENQSRQLNPIDHFFHSIADTQDERGIGIVLSGAGSDGTLGLKSISDACGMTFAQDAASAKYDSMPRSAATTGVADHVMTPGEIAAELLKYVDYLNESGTSLRGKGVVGEIESAIPQVAEELLRVTNHNFQHYKTSTLTRRIQRRMQVLKIASVGVYVQRLQGDRDEAQSLFRELLIGVTTFFRDPESFERLATEVLPKLFENRLPDDPVRIWVPGCASGEEAYTIAMLCAECIGKNQTQSHQEPGVGGREGGGFAFQIFASDIDERALSNARAGIYPIGITEHVSAQRLANFFVKKGKRYHVKKEIRDRVLFSSHNLISDPPFSRQDLISCRNLLIYLGPHLQKKLIPLFHYALRPNGFLFLGPSESLSQHGELFRTIDAKHRVSQRKGTAIPRSAPLDMRSAGVNFIKPPGSSAMDDDKSDILQIMQRIILDEFAPKSVVVDEEGQVICASAETHKYLSIGEGGFQNNILKMARRGLRIGLRAAFAESKAKRRRVVHENVSVEVDEGKQRVMLTVQPMMRVGEDAGLFMIVFHDVGLPMRLDTTEVDDATTIAARGTIDRQADAIIEQLERELTTTREDLEKSMQDMETANEELKSSNEELLSMNEELQSANEELETSKEEIRASSDAVARAHADMENLLRSTEIATVFLDDDYCIRSFTPAATKIYGLLPTDVGRPLAKFMPDLRDAPPLPDRSTIDGSSTVEETVFGNDGAAYLRRVLPYRDQDGNTDGIVLTFNDISDLKHTLAEVEQANTKFRVMFDQTFHFAGVLDTNGMTLEVNRTALEGCGYTREGIIGVAFWDTPWWSGSERIQNEIRRAVAVAGAGDTYAETLSYWLADGTERTVDFRMTPAFGDDGEVRYVCPSGFDVTERNFSEAQLLKSESLIRTIAENSTHGLLMMDDRGYVTYCNEVCVQMFGYSKEELQSKPLHDLIHHHYPDGRPYPMSECPIDRALPEDFSVRAHKDVFFRKDGTSFPVLCAASPIFENGKPVSTVIEVRDVTDDNNLQADLLQRQSQLAQAMSRLELSLEVSEIATWSWNMDTNAVLSNPTLNRMFGFEEQEQLTLTSFIEQMDESVRERVAEAIQRTIQTGCKYDQEYPIRLRDGGIRHIRAVGKVLAPAEGQPSEFFGVVLDMTERKQQELEQTRITKRMEMALRAGRMAAWEWTPAGSFWTPELHDLLGIGRDVSVSSELFFSLVHPDDVQPLSRHWRAAMDGESEFNSEFRIVRPDGVVRWVRGQGEIVKDANGKAATIYGINWDCTSEHEQAEAIRENERRAQEASASKSAFLANMSHEIRTPMTAILGYADLLRETITDDEAQHHLDTIRRNGDYLLEIINDILDLSKIEAGKFEVDHERFDVTRVVEDVRSVMEVRAKENHLKLRVAYEGKVPSLIESDSKRLKQILINLVGNAIKFTKRGSVKLVVGYDRAEPLPPMVPSKETTIGDKRSTKNRLRFRITDTGIGMSEEQQAKLFKPFEQGDSSVSRHFGGTGLGLAISRRLANMLGGEIDVHTELGHGSTFAFTIVVGDVADAALVTPTQSSNVDTTDRVAEPLPTLDCKVLVVDDRRDIRFLSKRILTQAGATVDECEDGQQAVEHIRVALDRAAPPDIVILDMQMPTWTAIKPPPNCATSASPAPSSP